MSDVSRIEGVLKNISAQLALKKPISSWASKAKIRLPPITSANGFGNPLANNMTNNTTNNDADQYIDFKTQVAEQLTALHKEVGDVPKFKAAVGLAQKLFRNVIDNPTEEKYRTVKINNQRIRDSLAKYVNGVALMRLLGFQQVYDNESKESVLKMSGTASTSYLKTQRLELDLAVTNFYSQI